MAVCLTKANISSILHTYTQANSLRCKKESHKLLFLEEMAAKLRVVLIDVLMYCVHSFSL